MGEIQLASHKAKLEKVQVGSGSTDPLGFTIFGLHVRHSVKTVVMVASFRGNPSCPGQTPRATTSHLKNRVPPVITGLGAGVRLGNLPGGAGVVGRDGVWVGGTTSPGWRILS